MIIDIIQKNRSIRRYKEVDIKLDTLKELIQLAQFSPSGGNRQPLKYILSCDPHKNSLIFPCLAWAAYFKDWSGPVEGERPSAYIIVLGDTEISKTFGFDCGIASQSILLGATEKGLGGCMLASIDRDALRSALNIEERYEIPLVIALGEPGEEVVLETVGADNDVKYWRDKNGVHHVPKRAIDDVIL
jgi:nitroreductase